MHLKTSLAENATVNNNTNLNILKSYGPSLQSHIIYITVCFPTIPSHDF